MKRWDSLNYAAAFEAADESTQRVLGEVWNRNVRATRVQANRAKAKAAPFDAKVRETLARIESRRGPVPSRGRASLIASALVRGEGGNPESVQRRVRASLERQGLR